MNQGKLLAGLDAGHVHTKAVIVGEGGVLGCFTLPTGLDAAAAAEAALNEAAARAGVAPGDLGGIAATGIFGDLLRDPPLKAGWTLPEYMAAARGALFLNRNSRTVIDIGANIHKAIRYDHEGNVQDVIQNDKCAEGLGIFYSNMAMALGLSEQEMSERALASTGNLSIAIQCVLSAESEVIDLMSRGMEVEDVADAVSRFMGGRVGAMCTTMSLAEEITAAGGLARSRALIRCLSEAIEREVRVPDLPEYVCAVGAAVSYGDEK